MIFNFKVIQSNTVISNFQNTCLEIYELDVDCFLSAPGVACQTAFKKTKVKLDLLIDINMLLMIEKGIKCGTGHAIYQYVKDSNKCMKDFDKNKEPTYLKHWDINNLYRWAMLQNLPVNNFKWVEETSQFKKDFLKIYNEDNNIEYFIEAHVQYSENLHNLHNAFFSEIINIEKIEKLFGSLHD